MCDAAKRRNNMKLYRVLLVLILIICQEKSEKNSIDQSNSSNNEIKSSELEKTNDAEKRFRDSLYNRESDNYISLLEEIPDRDSNAYKLTISSKKGNKRISKILNTRPRASMINYCTDLYTVVGFSCGGPCYSQVFVFTDDKRPPEQYDYAQRINGYPNIITHIEDEAFEKLVVHNFDNGKELIVENPDLLWSSYGHPDTMYIVGTDLKMTYQTVNHTTKTKAISLKKIVN